MTNYTHVLVLLHRDPIATLRDVSLQVGVTERAVQRIVKDMVDAGILSIEKDGRRNQYSINKDAKLRHPVESHCSIGDLLDLLDKTR